jgi:hypothetical protein
MPNIELRTKAGTISEGDLTLTISDQTYQYLLTSTTEKIRVSTYLDRDWPKVEAKYSELFVGKECKDTFRIVSVSPGSKTRKEIRLPDSMLNGEQLTLQVIRVTGQ